MSDLDPAAIMAEHDNHWQSGYVCMGGRQYAYGDDDERHHCLPYRLAKALAIAESGKARFLADFNEAAAALAEVQEREQRVRALLPDWEHEAQVDHDSSQHHYASVAVARRLQALRDQRRECAKELSAALDGPQGGGA